MHPEQDAKVEIEVDTNLVANVVLVKKKIDKFGSTSIFKT